MTDLNGEYCTKCIDNYYLGYIDKKCSTIKGCERSENENTCLECDEYYCLDMKTGKCVDNENIINEDKKFYFRCNKTNKEGNSCEICLNGYELNQNGLCVDEIHCVEKNENDSCKKCKNDENSLFYQCLNSFYGCVENLYTENCLECNNIFDFEKCTKCEDNFALDEENKCIKIKIINGLST